MREFLNGLTSRLAETFDLGRAGAALGDFLTGALVGSAVFVAYWFLWWILDRLARPVLKRAKLDATSMAFARTVFQYAILGVGLVHALDAGGLNTAGILASLGVVGLTVGFAARDALSNVVSGLLIFWDRPFVLGDLVEIDGHYGRVDRITLRSTRVVTTDGRMLAVPNTRVINSTVASYTNFPHLRLDIPITVNVESDLGRVREILLSIVRACPPFMESPAPRVRVTALNDYNVQVQLEVWLDNERDHVTARSELREAAYEALRSGGIDMPFETLRLEPLQVVSAKG